MAVREVPALRMDLLDTRLPHRRGTEHRRCPRRAFSEVHRANFACKSDHTASLHLCPRSRRQGQHRTSDVVRQLVDDGRVRTRRCTHTVGEDREHCVGGPRPHLPVHQRHHLLIGQHRSRIAIRLRHVDHVQRDLHMAVPSLERIAVQERAVSTSTGIGEAHGGQCAAHQCASRIQHGCGFALKPSHVADARPVVLHDGRLIAFDLPDSVHRPVANLGFKDGLHAIDQALLTRRKPCLDSHDLLAGRVDRGSGARTRETDALRERFACLREDGKRLVIHRGNRKHRADRDCHVATAKRHRDRVDERLAHHAVLQRVVIQSAVARRLKQRFQLPDDGRMLQCRRALALLCRCEQFVDNPI